jgi:hypothetical protein
VPRPPRFPIALIRRSINSLRIAPAVLKPQYSAASLVVSSVRKTATATCTCGRTGASEASAAAPEVRFASLVSERGPIRTPHQLISRNLYFSVRERVPCQRKRLRWARQAGSLGDTSELRGSGGVSALLRVVRFLWIQGIMKLTDDQRGDAPPPHKLDCMSCGLQIVRPQQRWGGRATGNRSGVGLRGCA